MTEIAFSSTGTAVPACIEFFSTVSAYGSIFGYHAIIVTCTVLATLTAIAMVAVDLIIFHKLRKR